MIDSKYFGLSGRLKNNAPQQVKQQYFIERAILLHGDKYDYSKVEYKNQKTKVILGCQLHGDFPQVPDSHLSGSGCKQCANLGQTKTTQQFIKEASQVHEDFYTYENTVYINNQTVVEITCPIHGGFLSSPNHHLSQKSGCAKCAGNAPLSSEEFISRQKVVHSDRYQYTKVKYLSSYDKVVITCTIHGDFLQEPRNHLWGKGCRECAGHKFNIDTLYLLKCLDTGLIKIGITSNLERRVKEIGNMLCLAAFKLDQPKLKEGELHKRFSDLRTPHPRGKELVGYTEFFSLSPLQLQVLKEELLKEVMDADQQIMG